MLTDLLPSNEGKYSPIRNTCQYLIIILSKYTMECAAPGIACAEKPARAGGVGGRGSDFGPWSRCRRRSLSAVPRRLPAGRHSPVNPRLEDRCEKEVWIEQLRSARLFELLRECGGELELERPEGILEWGGVGGAHDR